MKLVDADVIMKKYPRRRELKAILNNEPALDFGLILPAERALNDLNNMPDGYTFVEKDAIIKYIHYNAFRVDRSPHQYWKRPNPGAQLYVCSGCGYSQGHESNYCQHCGARMDGGKEDGESSM